MAGITGCGEDDQGDAEPAGSEGPGASTSPSALEQKLAACPTVQNTSDVTASVCLEGTYQGETFAGDACSLTLGEGGAYTFSSPTLSVTSEPKADSIFLFGHNFVGGFGQLTWIVSDPISTEAWYDLDFTARYGETTPAADRKIDIEVQRRDADSMMSVTCTVTY